MNFISVSPFVAVFIVFFFSWVFLFFFFACFVYSARLFSFSVSFFSQFYSFLLRNALLRIFDSHFYIYVNTTTVARARVSRYEQKHRVTVSHQKLICVCFVWLAQWARSNDATVASVCACGWMRFYFTSACDSSRFTNTDKNRAIYACNIRGPTIDAFLRIYCSNSMCAREPCVDSGHRKCDRLQKKKKNNSRARALMHTHTCINLQNNRIL